MSSLIVALDLPDAEAALAMAKRLQGAAPWVKVGLQLYVAEGPSIIGRLKDLGFSVFADLKFFDIPTTVRGAVTSACRSGADMVNIHLLGGERMIQAAVEGRDEAAPGTLLFGVTVLTSMDARDLNLPDGGLAESVLALATNGHTNGMDGVVCSGYEVERIKKRCGDAFACLTPGIRPPGADANDQRRVMTPAQAVAAGADYLVVGRPVTQAASPHDAARAIVDDMATGEERSS